LTECGGRGGGKLRCRLVGSGQHFVSGRLLTGPAGASAPLHLQGKRPPARAMDLPPSRMLQVGIWQGRGPNSRGGLSLVRRPSRPRSPGVPVPLGPQHPSCGRCQRRRLSRETRLHSAFQSCQRPDIEVAGFKFPSRSAVDGRLQNAKQFDGLRPRIGCSQRRSRDARGWPCRLGRSPLHAALIGFCRPSEWPPPSRITGLPCANPHGRVLPRGH